MNHLVRPLLRAKRQSTAPGDRSVSTSLDDAEFGAVTIRRNARSRYVRLRMQPNGELVVTMPPRAALTSAQRLIDSSRSDIRKWRASHLTKQPIYRSGDLIGHSHKLVVITLPDPNARASVRTKQLEICLYLPQGGEVESAETQRLLFPEIKKALTKQAKAYLPRRLKYFADQHDFSYAKTRFATQRGRWGSCSSSGTISLNINLMTLSHELIDYVLVHELCHTKQMNHSVKFWALVENILPNYKTLRKELKTKHPIA